MEINLGIKHECIDNILYFSMNNVHEFLVGTRPSGEMKNNPYVKKVSGTVLIGRKQSYVYGVSYQNLNAFIKTLKKADENKIKLLKAYASYIYHTFDEESSVENNKMLKQRMKVLQNKERILEEENNQLKKIILEMKSVLENIETT